MTNMMATADRRQRVLLRIGQERLELVEQARSVISAFNPIRKVQSGVSHIADHPLLWLVSAGLVVFSIGPNRLVRTLLSAWNVWQLMRFFKKRGIWSG
jgi:hypothetical protein